jgi:dCMP deaminase
MNGTKRQKYKHAGTSVHELYGKDNPEYQRVNRERYLTNNYGLTIAQYDIMSERQGNVCAICKQTEPVGNLVVDHDHKTGKVRGLLCNKCNRAIGSLQDDISVIRSASLYLLNHNPAAGWDEYFLHLAQVVATRSKDPSTQVGAIIVQDRTIVSTGYNGFPRGVNDNISERYDRPLKYTWMCHAEENALLNAAREGIKVEGGTIYVTPLSPCMRCARGIIQAGIKEVVYSQPVTNPRMNEELQSAIAMLSQSGVVVHKNDGIL